ncbi:12933_t:CDS:2, partial [Racocetra fulgida]
AAKAIGMATGLVVTSRITHATPASFSAHVVDRNMEDIIATQQLGDYPLGRQVDLMMGGDRTPSVEPSLKEMSEKAIRILEAQTAHSDK